VEKNRDKEQGNGKKCTHYEGARAKKHAKLPQKGLGGQGIPFNLRCRWVGKIGLANYREKEKDQALIKRRVRKV